MPSRRGAAIPAAQLLSLGEVADRLGVHYMTVYRYVRTGVLPARQDGARWVVEESAVEALGRGERAARRTGAEGAGWSGRAQARRRLAVSLTRGDEAGSWAIVQTTLAQGATPEETYMDLIAPVLSAIGEQWEAATTTVGEEHAATAVATRLIGRMGPLFRPAGRPRGLVITGAVAGERHALPGALLADVVRSAGFQVLDLGADTPVESFLQQAEGAARLIAVLVGATMPDRQHQIASTVSALRASTGATVLAGGAAVPSRERAGELGADGWSGLDARAALAAIEELAAGRAG